MSAEVRTQLYSTFMETFFAPYNTTNGKDDSLYFLLAHFPILAGESELFDQSVIALASAFLGKKNGDGLLARRGLEIYSSALNVMTRALRQKAPPTSNLLYATILLHTYETVYGNTNALQNCFVHIQGANAILKHHNFKTDDTQTLTKVMLTRQKWAAELPVDKSHYLCSDKETLNSGAVFESSKGKSLLGTQFCI
ncbi:hypothetical protein N7513_002939 [Penicillium frequentans]|nr:hypothetical protein N7513_002939 [Penicillium glabrum]